MAKQSLGDILLHQKLSKEAGPQHRGAEPQQTFTPPVDAADPRVEKREDAQPSVQEPPKPKRIKGTPEAVKVINNYGYYNDDGLLRFWAEGTVENDPAEIETLIERGAPIEEVKPQ